MNPILFLQLLNERFPLSTMSPNFKGAHGMTLSKSDDIVGAGQLTVTIWQSDKCYPVYLTAENARNSEQAIVDEITKVMPPVEQTAESAT